MNKKGVSGIIAAVILILLVIVMTGIIWVVVKNLVSDELDDVSAGTSRISLEIKNTEINQDNVAIRVKRNIGKGNLTKIKFIVSDGKDKKTVDLDAPLEELDESTFNLSLITFNFVYFEEISIAPIIIKESGKESVRNEVSKYEFTAKEKLEFFPNLASWWKLDGGAKDFAGENDGITKGGVVFSEGKFEKAGEFDGVDDRISVSEIIPNIVIVMWIKNDTEWKHLTLSSGITYVNGQIQSTELPFNQSDIGVYSSGIFFNGSIDEIMIFNESLNPEQITALYNMDLS